MIQVITTLDTETRDLREIRGSQLTTDNAKLVQGRHTHIQTGNSNYNRQVICEVHAREDFFTQADAGHVHVDAVHQRGHNTVVCSISASIAAAPLMDHAQSKHQVTQ